MRAAVLLAFVLLVLSSRADAAGPPVKLHGLSSADFDKLPADAALDVGGRVLMKSQFLSELHAGSAGPASTSPNLEAVSAQIAREDKSKADQANAIVLGRATALRVKTSASRLTPIEPHIAEVPFDASPGFLVLVLGSGFGDRAGELHLKFPKGFVDLPLLVGARIPREVASQLDSSRTWADDQVLALIPPGLSGVADQTAEVIVVRADGRRSAPAPIRFVPAREVRRIPADRVRQLIPDDGGCGHYPTSSLACQYGSNFHVWHFGEDEVRPEKASFKNGWRQYLTWFARELGSASPGCHARVVATPLIPPFDQPMFVTWWGDCQTTYEVSYTIVGPRGVPYE